MGRPPAGPADLCGGVLGRRLRFFNAAIKEASLLDTSDEAPSLL